MTSPKPDRPLLLGHRGARGARATTGVRENTLASFDLALAHGCDGFELDVRGTADGGLAICHDPRVEGNAVSSASRNDLPSLAWLEDVLARYEQSAFLDIELKVKGLEPATLAAVAKHTPQRGRVISSFLPDVIMELKRRSPDTPVGIICETRAQIANWDSLPVDYVMIEQALLTQQLVEEIRSAGCKVFAWTINDAKSMLRYADWGIDGIISDNTQILAETLLKR